MSRLIDADTTELELCDRLVIIGEEYQCAWVEYKDIDEVFKSAKTVDAVPVVHGHWGEPQGDGCVTYDKNAYRQCSVCGNRQFLGMQMNYCPHCGAKMDEVTE